MRGHGGHWFGWIKIDESDNSFWCGNSSDWAHEKMGEDKTERSPLNKKGWQKRPDANRIVRVKY